MIVEISEKQHVSLCELESVVSRLDGIGLILIEEDYKEWSFLNISPKGLLIHYVFEFFHPSFAGQFIDKETGVYLQQNNTLKFIRKEYEHINRVIKSRL